MIAIAIGQILGQTQLDNQMTTPLYQWMIDKYNLSNYTKEDYEADWQSVVDQLDFIDDSEYFKEDDNNSDYSIRSQTLGQTNNMDNQMTTGQKLGQDRVSRFLYEYDECVYDTDGAIINLKQYYKVDYPVC